MRIKFGEEWPLFMPPQIRTQSPLAQKMATVNTLAQKFSNPSGTSLNDMNHVTPMLMAQNAVLNEIVRKLDTQA